MISRKKLLIMFEVPPVCLLFMYAKKKKKSFYMPWNIKSCIWPTMCILFLCIWVTALGWWRQTWSLVVHREDCDVLTQSSCFLLTASVLPPHRSAVRLLGSFAPSSADERAAEWMIAEASGQSLLLGGILFLYMYCDVIKFSYFKTQFMRVSHDRKTKKL